MPIPEDPIVSPEKTAQEKIGYKLPIFMPLIVIGGIAAVAMAYLLSMRALGWKDVDDIRIPVMLGASVLDGGNSSIYLYKSKNSESYFASVGGKYDVLVAPWRKHFSDTSTRFSEIGSPQEIAQIARGVLVLPSAVALGDDERREILDFSKRGGNILASWATGSRNAAGEWTGYEFLKNLLSVGVTGEIPAGDPGRFLNLYGETPVSAPQYAGQRLWMGNISETPLLLKGGQIAGVASNWQRTATPEKNTSLVVFDEAGDERRHARWVMFGFAETSWEYQHQDIRNLVSSSLKWLQHEPAVYKANWPYPYRAAQIIEMDTEQGFPTALDFAGMMDRYRLPATFYSLTSEALKYPDIVKTLARSHEIAYHGDIHIGFRNQPETEQANRIRKMKSDMQGILGDTRSVVGFRAPTEEYDKTTESLLLKADIRHHTADPNRSNRRLPLFSDATHDGPERALVVLPRTQRDDINLIRDGLLHGADPAAIGKELIDDFNLSTEMGGLGLLSIHTQNFDASAPLPLAMPAYLAHVQQRRNKVWVGHANKIADWWRDRERLEYEVSGSAGKLELNVSIKGKEAINGVSLVITNPQANAVPKIQPLKANTPMPQVQALDAMRTALIFSSMQAGNYGYTVAY